MAHDRRQDVGRTGSVDEPFFRRRSVDVARDLVGSMLLRERDAAGPVGGIVTETEAYVGRVDPACHLAAGRTDRTRPFFSGPGTVYVFTIWGHANLNVITEYRGQPEGVLIRALEPTHGLGVMAENRGGSEKTLLTSGPGRLTEAMGVTKARFNDRPLAETDLRIERTELEPEIAVGPRIGITDAADWPLRFCLADSRFLSEPVPDDPALDRAAVERAYAELATVEQSTLGANRFER